MISVACYPVVVASAAQGRMAGRSQYRDSGEVTDLEGESGRRRAAARRHPRLLVKQDSNTDLFKFFAACDPRAIFQPRAIRVLSSKCSGRAVSHAAFGQTLDFTFGPGIPEKRWLRSR